MSEQLYARRVVAVPGWWSTLAEAEDATMRTLAPADVLSACTHALDGIAVATVELMPGVPASWAGHEPPSGRIAHLAEQAHARRLGGRAFVFGGMDAVTDRMTVRELLACCEIDSLVLPGAAECDPGLLVVDAAGCRPRYREGRLVLTVRPDADGTVRPFERRTPRGTVDVPARLAH